MAEPKKRVSVAAAGLYLFNRWLLHIGQRLLMTIKFKCEHCQKPLSVKDHLAGKKADCPVCKKKIVIPAAMSEPADLEAFAAEALADQPAEKAPAPVSTKTIEFPCPFCDEQVKVSADEGGKKLPCPHCTNIVKVPLPDDNKPKDWRDLQKKGPTAALSNLPEQLEDAWGTEQKGKVSRAAMEEAGALPDPVAKPLGLAGWAGRIFKWGAVAGLFLLVIAFLIQAAAVKNENKAIAFGVEYAKKPETKPLHKAAIHRAIGELYVRNRDVVKARQHFLTARALLEGKDDSSSQIERDLMLIHVLLSQAEMGGTTEESLQAAKVRPRFDWKDGEVQKDLLQTLNAMSSNEAKSSGLRKLGSRLIDLDKIEVAMGLANGLANPQISKGVAKRSPFFVQQVGFLLKAKNEKVAAGYISPPETGKPLVDILTRVAYTEGHARSGNYDEALSLITTKGSPTGTLEASVAGAAIAQADTKNKDKAGPFIKSCIREGIDVVSKDLKTKASPWVVMELIRVGSRTDLAEEVKSLASFVPAAYKGCVQLDILQAQLEKANSPAQVIVTGDVDPKSNEHALAWESLARQNARLGASKNVRPSEVDEALRPFIHLGLALGEKESPAK